MQAPEVRNWWNIRLAGKTKSIPENNTMWSVLTTASATPVLELDFLGADAHELLGFSDPAKFAALQSGVDPCPLLLCMSDVDSQTDSLHLQAPCTKIVMQQWSQMQVRGISTPALLLVDHWLCRLMLTAC